MTDWDTGVPAPGQADGSERAETAEEPDGARACPWCAAGVKADDTHCPECGAALAQRESIAGLKIPGLTSVDPALEDFDKRPLHLRGPSPSHGVAPALIVGAMAGGPIGLVAMGGVAAVAAAELMGATHGDHDETALEDIGRPNELVLQAIEHADATDREAGDTEVEAEDGEPDGADPDHAADEGGRSIWRDLPPPSDEPADEADRS